MLKDDETKDTTRNGKINKIRW